MGFAEYSERWQHKNTPTQPKPQQTRAADCLLVGGSPYKVPFKLAIGLRAMSNSASPSTSPGAVTRVGLDRWW